MAESTETAMKEKELLRFVWRDGQLHVGGARRHYSREQLQALEMELGICQRWVRVKLVESDMRQIAAKVKNLP
jgi:hypothetical protein